MMFHHLLFLVVFISCCVGGRRGGSHSLLPHLLLLPLLPLALFVQILDAAAKIPLKHKHLDKREDEFYKNGVGRGGRGGS